MSKLGLGDRYGSGGRPQLGGVQVVFREDGARSAACVVAGRRYAACTIVARNYIGFARVLEDSFRAANPDIDFITLIIDGSDEDRSGCGLTNVLLIEDLGLSPDVSEPMVLMYGVTELATALKPATLQLLLTRGYDAAAYFDPDIWVREDVSDIFDQAALSGIVLTPHALQPVPRDGLEIRERGIMQAGIFNLGFIAVGASAGDFLSWWHERLRIDAVVDFQNALFTDQRWIDWVPALFPHCVSRDPGLNVAYWNLHERPLTREAGGRLLAAGAPLRFVHFSGFDLANPWVLSRFTGDYPRVLVSGDPLLRELCLTYAALLTGAGHESQRLLPYGNAAVPDGPLLTTAVRRVYRDAVIGTLPFPDPPRRPLSEPEAFSRWFTAAMQTSPWSRMAPVEFSLWRDRLDLQATYPSPFGASSLAFRRWLDGEPSVARHYNDLGLAAPDQATPSVVPAPDSGWSLVVAGYPEPSGETRAVAGRVAVEIARAGIPVTLVTPVDGHGGRPPTWIRHELNGRGAHANVILCIDADRFSEDRLVQALGEHPGRCIGLWISSETSVEAERRLALSLFDEIWALGQETEEVIRAVTSRPVHRIYAPPTDEADPLAENDALPALETSLDTTRAGSPVILIELDAFGDFDAQNPADAIAAYRTAFTEDDGARLIVDVRHGEPMRRHVDALMHAADGRPDIMLLTPASSGARTGSLVAGVDAVLSLHRADGVGLPVLAAIEAGVPVVVTGFGGAVSYLDEDRASLVPYSLAPRPAPRVGMWALPDVAAAAKAHRTLVDAPDRARRAAAIARTSIGVGVVAVAGRLSAQVPGNGTPAHLEQVAAVSLRRALAAEQEGLSRWRALRNEVERLESELAGIHATRVFRYTRRLRKLYAARR